MSSLNWTMFSPLEKEVSLTDPLAFDYFAQQLGNIILPSFTTRTSRARYYSMVCYGLYICRKYLEKEGIIPRSKEITELYKLYEKYWAYSVCYYYKYWNNDIQNNEIDFRGKNGANKAVQNEEDNLDYFFLARQLELGSLGAYKSSLISLNLIKNDDYQLTHAGERLARAFLASDFDNMFIEVLKKKKIIKKYGHHTLSSLGSVVRLDFDIKSNQSNEKNLLIASLINNERNYATIKLIDFFTKQHNELNEFEVIQNIAKYDAINNEEFKVVESCKTIMAFENLSIQIIKIWTEIISVSEKSLGRIEVSEVVSELKNELDIFFSDSSIKKLLEQSNYNELITKYHGPELNAFLVKYKATTVDYESFIRDLIRYHIAVTESRNTGSWIQSEGNYIVVSTGFDYAKSIGNISYLHGYKVNNIRSLIYDTGWNYGI